MRTSIRSGPSAHEAPAQPVRNTLRLEAEAAIREGFASHSPDFSSIWWFGKYYEFTPIQAAVVSILWEAWRHGTPGVSQPHLLRESGAPVTSRLADIFRSSKAWGGAIICSRRNVYRLNKPQDAAAVVPHRGATRSR